MWGERERELRKRRYCTEYVFQLLTLGLGLDLGLDQFRLFTSTCLFTYIPILSWFDLHSSSICLSLCLWYICPAYYVQHTITRHATPPLLQFRPMGWDGDAMDASSISAYGSICRYPSIHPSTSLGPECSALFV